jgi:hypothetical protein
MRELQDFFSLKDSAGIQRDIIAGSNFFAK